MKKILLLITVAMMVSCANKKTEKAIEEAKADSLSRPENVNVVAAIGKIEPIDGMVEIAAEKGGIVTNVYKQTGDLVHKGETLVTLNQATEISNERAARSQISTRQNQARADAAMIAQYEAQLREKEKDLAASERLVRTGAETRQNVDIKRKERDVILSNLRNAQANVAVSRSQINEAMAQLNEAQVNTQRTTVKAKETGIIVSMDAKPGQAISELTPFATLAPAGPLVVHGEIDEMFASRVNIGDTVLVRYPGNASQLATGKVIYLSPVLDGKSLFYEKAGETQDRRVRRFKAAFDGTPNLLINEKVEAIIHLQRR